MKREFVAVALLLALLILSLMNVHYIESRTDALSNQIQSAEELYTGNDRAGASRLVEASLNSWLDWNSYSHIMLRHSEVDLVTDAFYSLLEELEGGETVTEASFDSLRETLGDIVKKERVSLGSLL